MPDDRPRHTAPAASAAEEIAAFQANFPLVEHVDLLVPDMAGTFRGKRLPAAQLAKTFEQGVRLPISTYALDVTGQNCEAAGLGFTDGDQDFFCPAIPGSLKYVPWTNRPTAQVLAGMCDEDGTPMFADPRQVLVRAIDRLQAMDLTPVCAIELEFYLLDPAPGPDGGPQPAAGPHGVRPETVQVYGMDELYDIEGFLDDLADACHAQDIPAETMTSEYAAGQFEVNLIHGPDALAQADQAALLKRAVKGVARRHGMQASFMAKPFAEGAGSGLHVHLSLLTKDGRNLFAGQPGAISDPLRHAIGGCLALMADSMAIFAPGANSYRRFAINSYAPNSPNWGTNNRTVAVRVPPSPPEAARLEHRAAGSDANVYVALAAVLHAAAHGLEHALEPPPPVEGNAYLQAPSGFYDTGLPLTWPHALDRFDASTDLIVAFGDEYHRLFSAVKRTEMARYDAVIPALDFAWYQRTV